MKIDLKKKSEKILGLSFCNINDLRLFEKYYTLVTFSYNKYLYFQINLK